MKIAEFSVKHSLFVNLLTVFAFALGIVAVFMLRRDAFPEVSFDTVTVTTVYPGAPTEDIEKLITIPLEKEIKSVSGIKEINSSSDEGLSSIGITLEPAVSDKDKVVDDIRRAVDRVEDLPLEAEDPDVIEMTTKERPIIEVSISGDISEFQRRQYAESLEEALENVDGVAKVTRIGWRDPQMWVEADPQKMQELYVSMTELIQALRDRNITIPGGELNTDKTEFNIRITGEFTQAEEIAQVVIRANDAGHQLKVKDVAKVFPAFEDENRIAKINGHRATAMVVLKRENADVLDVAKDVKKALEDFKAQLPQEVEITISNDFSYYVQRRLGVVVSNGLLGFFLVIAVLFTFMDKVPAILTALGIPFALFVTFAVMNMLGMSLNLITMLGLIIVLGMLVDDGIVISENVYRYIEQGMHPREAAVKGAAEVMVPVLGTVTTTWAAFLPLMLMTDIIGKFIRDIPIVIIIALSASLLEAFVVLPAHLADFVKPLKKDAQGRVMDHQQKPWYQKMLKGYTKLLKFVIRRRYHVALAMTVVFIFTMFVAVKYMKVILFTGEGIEQFMIRAEAPKGTPLAKTSELIEPVEALIAGLSRDELDSYRSYSGSIELEGGFDPNAKRGSHLAQVTVFLTPMQKRDRLPDEIVKSLRPALEKIKGFDKLYFYKPKEGPPVGMPVEVAVKGDDYAVLQEIAKLIQDELAHMKGVFDVATNYDFGKHQIKVVINEEKAKKYNMSISDIATTVRYAFEGGRATSIKPLRADEEIDVLVRFPEDHRRSFEDFKKILIPNKNGKLIPLSAIAAIEESEGVYLITHLDGKRVIMVTADVDNQQATSLSVNNTLKKKFSDISSRYMGYSVNFVGEYEEQMASRRNLLVSMALAMLLIFIILAAIFNSLIEPFIVMLAVPFGLVGVILAFLIHGRPLSFFAFMGLVGLSGVVVNNSIVMVEFINKLRKEGLPMHEAIIESCRIRLRPILMTTITTVVGLISVAYGIGGGDPFLKPMALAIIWGLTISTILTLTVLPSYYAIVDDFSEKILRKHMVKADAAAAGSV